MLLALRVEARQLQVVLSQLPAEVKKNVDAGGVQTQEGRYLGWSFALALKLGESVGSGC